MYKVGIGGDYNPYPSPSQYIPGAFPDTYANDLKHSKTLPLIFSPETFDSYFGGFGELQKKTSASSWQFSSDIKKTNDVIPSGVASRSIVSIYTPEANPNYVYAFTQGNSQEWCCSNRHNYLFKSTTGYTQGLSDYNTNHRFLILDYPGFDYDDEDNTILADSTLLTDIDGDPSDPNKIWICYSGYDVGHKVFSANDGGEEITNWVNEDPLNTLPNLPVNCMVYQKNTNDRVYIGTDAGVFYKDDATIAINGGWKKYGDIPNVRITDLEINYCSQKLIASTWGRGLWEVDVLPAEHYNHEKIIANSVTWGGNAWSDINIRVESGNTLTITGSLNMAENTRILVEANAELNVNGGTITSSCGDIWEGITVLGDPTLPQNTNNQGRVVLYNSAIIENAKYAVSNVNRIPGVGLFPSGGIIHANGAIFKNNITDVEMSQYQNIQTGAYELDNTSFFKGCTFETTDDYSASTMGANVYLTHVNGVGFKANTFEDKRTNINVLQDGRTGIHSNSSGFRVNEFCAMIYPHPQPATCNGDRNKFINLKYGIKAYGLDNPSQFSIEIKNTDFNCANGVYLMDIENAEIHMNQFTVDQAYEENLWGENIYGLYLDYCSNYDVEGNDFMGVSPSLPFGTTVGIAIKNEHSENTSIYRNTFNNIIVGTEAIGQNKYPDWSVQTGLIIQCNEYEDGYANIYITHDQNNPGPINGIALGQGVNGGATNALAGNLFGTNSTKHIYNASVCDYFSYYHHNPVSEPRVEPTLNSGSFGVFGDPTKNYSSSSCPNNLETVIGPGFKSLAIAETQTIAETDATLNSLVDGGNTTELKNDVIFANNQDAYETYNDLMSKEGYLSEEVLEEVAAKETALNKAMVRDVLVANPQAAKSTNVQEKLDQRADVLPEYMRAQIQEGLTELSAKEYLELRKAKAKVRHDFLINSGVRSLLKDSLDRTDDILEVLSNTGDLAFEYRKLAILDAKNRTTEAEQVLAAMQTMEKSDNQTQDLQDFTDLRTLLNTWKQEGKNMNALAESDINTLKTFVGKKNKSAAKAMVILELNGLLEYKAPLYMPEEDNNRSAVENWSSFGAPTVEKDMLKLYPNPAKDYFTVEYSFTSKEKPIVFKVTDVQGKILYTKELQYKHDQLVIDASSYQNGTYYISLFAGNQLIKPKSIQINK